MSVLIPPVSPPEKKKSASQLQIPGLAPSNPQSVEDEDITTTTGLEDSLAREFEQKLEACRTAGIYYHPKDAKFCVTFRYMKSSKGFST
jgi:hypothetical protein